ncbi:ABC transporter permease subunit [Nocardioides marmoribigeumensis]|uniref:ABC-2 type transport system permease protein n=1 Tax=Nocardioides marmoribigeumensis TaxID=433649 RepID=A0ABU2BRR0_9ACTN|nr:ABC transporter permease subunit [Nocardioides marmoribigeumensis]MDR7360674.1 ABC-2 type transport system permease protein [Nocardioides marmoribigeumensis]
MTLFRKTMRDQRRALVGWGAGVVLLVLAESALWPTVRDMPDFGELLKSYPEGMRELFNVEAMTTGRGFLNAELFSLLLPALFITYAVGRGARLVAGEEEDGTLEVLLVTPLSTGRLLWEKALALATSVALLGVVLALGTWLCSLVFGLDLSLLQVLAGSLAVSALGLEYGLLALAVGAATARRAVAVGVATAAAVAAYVLYAVALFVDWLADWRGWSPFEQALSAGPLAGSVPWQLVWVGLAGLVAVALAAPILARRDIAAA